MALSRFFISYSHQNSDFVVRTVVPLLRLAGLSDRQILIDVERFTLGKGVKGQMDGEQAQATHHLLFLSKPYMKSDYCQHEMAQALKTDPDFSEGRVVPCFLESVPVPEIQNASDPPLWVNFAKAPADAWQALWKQLGLNRPLPGPAAWVRLRDAVRQDVFEQGRCVHLQEPYQHLESVIQHLQKDWDDPPLIEIDCGNYQAQSRRQWVAYLFNQLGAASSPRLTDKDNEDFIALGQFIEKRGRTCVLFRNFHAAPEYTQDHYRVFYNTLRSLVENGKLIALFQSRQPLDQLIPENHPLSALHAVTLQWAPA